MQSAAAMQSTNYGGKTMENFLTELRLALEDYFCGKFTEEDGKIIAELDGGHKFTIKVEKVEEE